MKQNSTCHLKKKIQHSMTWIHVYKYAKGNERILVRSRNQSSPLLSSFLEIFAKVEKKSLLGNEPGLITPMPSPQRWASGLGNINISKREDSKGKYWLKLYNHFIIILSFPFALYNLFPIRVATCQVVVVSGYFLTVTVCIFIYGKHCKLVSVSKVHINWVCSVKILHNFANNVFIITKALIRDTCTWDYLVSGLVMHRKTNGDCRRLLVSQSNQYVKYKGHKVRHNKDFKVHPDTWQNIHVQWLYMCPYIVHLEQNSDNCFPLMLHL